MNKLNYYACRRQSYGGPHQPYLFCMSVEDNGGHGLIHLVFLKEVLILDYRGLSVQKGVVFFYFFVLYFKAALRILLICYMNVDDNRVHRLSQMVF